MVVYAYNLPNRISGLILCIANPLASSFFDTIHGEYGLSFVTVIIVISLLAVLVVPEEPTQAALECKGNGLYTITVSKGGRAGKGDFATIQEAVDSIPSNNEQWTKILVKPGVYKEQVEIPFDKECIVLEGENRLTTIITSSARETDRIDATVVVGASKGRHFFNSCYIEGAADFIWGAGQSFYQSCLINSTDQGFITAQGREKPTDTNGFVFSDCQVTGKGPTYLGRAYRPYAAVVFIRSYFDDIIAPQGWNPRIFLKDVDKFTFAEVNCRGPGADQPHRVHWEKHLDNQDLQNYNRDNFIDQENWIANQPN